MIEMIKSMGLYPCLRCLVLKGDIPEVGSFLDMKNHQKTAHVYSIENVEIIHKVIFDSSQSTSYNRPYDMLKTGSWVLTQVCSSPTLAPQLIDRIFTECICD
jgi:hypothetical protein